MVAVEPDRADALAARLTGEFGSLARLWSQNREAIERVVGKDSPIVPLLLAARDAMLESMRGELPARSIAPCNTKLTAYLTASMGSLPDETLRVLFLNGSHSLIADEQMQRGTIDQLIVYPRVIFRRALELNAAALILVHNHPSGDPRPSRNDVLVTDRLVEIGRSLGIDILEHIVVTATEHRFILRNGARTWPKTAPRSFDLRSGRGGPADAEDHNRGGVQAALANARRTGRRRLLRRQLLGADALFGEPAWDMLIDLFIHHCKGVPVSTSSLCVASDLSMSSALRLVQRMIDADLLEREADPEDGRRNFINLSSGTAHRLMAFFGEHGE